MAGFFKKVFGGGEEKTPDPRSKQPGGAPVVEGPIEVAKLTELLRYFPLGEKVRYYPEFQKDAALETIVLGYGVNNQFIYSPIDIRCQQDGERDVIRLTVDGHEVLVRDVDNFCFLIPFNREDENKRDYVRKAELGPRGPFRRSNTISLVACSTGGTMSSIDTVVRKILPLNSGIYAGHDVVVLDVMPDSMNLTDQRQHYRLHTSIAATLTVRDGHTHPCTVIDFSEESVQLVFEQSNADLMALSEFRRLALKMNVGTDKNPKEYVLDGVMYRKTDTSLVMKLQGIYKDGSIKSMGLVDILDIKANLLRHPATQQALAERRNA